MDTNLLNTRRAVAVKRIAEAAETLGDNFGLKEEAAAVRDVKQRDSAVELLFRLEAVAVLLETLNERQRTYAALTVGAGGGASATPQTVPAVSASGEGQTDPGSESEGDDEMQSEPEDLSALTKEKLMELAEERGVALKASMTKGEMLAAFEQQ